RRRSGHRHRFRKRPSFLRVGSVRRTHLFDVLPHPEKPLGKKLLEGDPVIVIRDLKILENNLRKSRFNVDQIMQLLREKDVLDVSQAQYAILENDGSLSVMRKPEYQQLTPQSLSQPQKKPEVPMELVVDGQIIYENLRKIGKTGRWLMDQLKKRKVKSLRDVFYVSLESDGSLYVDMRRDQVH